MDLNNLVTVEYSVSYNQTKLQNVIKQLESKITIFDNSIKSIDEKYKQMQQSQSNVHHRIEKFEQFTIDNLRMTLGEVSNLKDGLRTCLGDEWIKQLEKAQTQPKSNNLSRMFESRLSAFNSQTKQLSEKVSELKIEMTKKSTYHEEQAEQVKNTIKEQKTQINKIRESIRQDIKQKFSHYKKEFEEKNIKQIMKKVQIVSDASMKSLSQIELKTKEAINKAIKQEKRVSINHSLGQFSSGQLPLGIPNTMNNLGSCNKFLMGNRDNGDIQDVIEFDTDIKNQNRPYMDGLNEMSKISFNEYNHMRNSIGLNFMHHMNPPVNPGENLDQKMQTSPKVIKNSVQSPSMQHATEQLRDQLKNIIRMQTMEFKSAIQALNASKEKTDSSISILFKESKDLKADSAQTQSRFSDLKNELENVRNSVYENKEKQNQSLGRIIEQQSKNEQLQSELQLLSKNLQALVSQSEEYESLSKFRDIQNVGGRQSIENSAPSNHNRSGIKNSLIYKNSISTPMLQSDNIVMSRLNLLTQKVAKLEQKAKINSVGSEKNLPKLNSSTCISSKNGANSPSMDLLRNDLQKTNQQLNRTNERLQNLKKNLKELEAAHSLIPNRLSKLQTQVTHINEIQQDRLLQLIKELINRVLTDPFNNHFTNTLKKQIHVKFLEIKHEYSSIWKDIETKVTDRAETAQLQKLKQTIDTQNVEIKALIGKKADNDDFKKGIKYIDTKLKEVYSYLKGKEDLENSPQGRKYYMGKKA